MVRRQLLSLLIWPAALIAVVGLAAIGFLCYMSRRSDPYSAVTQVELPYSTYIDNKGQIKIKEHFIPSLKNGLFSRLFSLLQTGVRIPLYSLLVREQPLQGNASEIIAQIHTERFNPERPYVITGSHYSDLYIRNLGIFFNALLDPRLPTSLEDWQNRQRIALQTVQYDLEFFRQNRRAVTTIAPVGRRSFTGLNIYTEPSDAVHGVLYTLLALRNDDFISRRFPVTAKPSPSAHPLQTQSAASELLASYTSDLSAVLNHYLATVIDPETGLVRRDIHLSGARDGVKRESSFFDNVIAWSSVQLADELGIPHSPTVDADTWKTRIIEQYWDESQGIFRDEVKGCDAAGQNCPPAQFSADSLIVTSTGFLDLQQPTDREKLHSIIEYIRRNQLDEPFPLRYTKTNEVTEKHLTVQLFAPSYMGDGVWSHWGMEYIKALLMLGDEFPGSSDLARRHLDTYRQNIERDGGYPELYNTDGTMFHSTLLRGVLHTGWVVNYEQARMMAGSS